MRYTQIKSLICLLILLIFITSSGASALVEQRIKAALDYIKSNPWPSPQTNVGFKQHMALLLLYQNEQIEEANTMITEFCSSYTDIREEALLRIYLLDRTRNLLTPAAKQAIENYCWNMLNNNNRGITRAEADKDYWDYSGSENHFLNDRRRYTLALRVVKLSDTYGPDAMFKGEKISAHYKAWEDFWIRYFPQRAKEGVDMEVNHPSSYGECTVGVYYDLYDLTEHSELKRLAGNFLNLYWAEVASEFEPRTGQRAGWAATRNPYYAGEREYWAKALLYTYTWHNHGYDKNFLGEVTFLTSAYRTPQIIKAIASDTQRDKYFVTSRRAGLQERELDDHNIFDENGNSHIRRDTYYTNDYALSTIAYDPARHYDQHITLAQTMGVTFASDLDARITVMGSGYYSRRAVNGITGEAVSVIARDINASYGVGRFLSNGTRVFINKGDLWNNRVEDGSGWFFTYLADAYVAIMVNGGYSVTDQTYIWPDRQLQIVTSQHGYYLEFNNMWAPVVIQMGRAGDYASFADFQNSVKANQLDFANGKMTYQSESGDVYEYWSQNQSIQLPKINGSEVNLNPEKTYDTPYLSMIHGSDVATIIYPGIDDLELDFGPVCGSWGYYDGDINTDCYVDIKDIEILAKLWLAEPGVFIDYIRMDDYENYNIPFLQGVIHVDGQLNPSEWEGAKRIDMVYPHLVTPPNNGTLRNTTTPPANREAFSLTWFLKWDSDYLYIAAEVLDNDYNPMAFRDEPQLLFNLLNNPSASYPQEAFVWNLPANAGIRRNGSIAIPENTVLAGSITETGYVIEMKMAWSDIDDSYNPAIGDVHGFGLSCADHTSAGLLQTHLLDFGKGIFNMTDISTWGSITLVEYLELSDYGYYTADINSDGDVDFADFYQISRDWMKCTDPDLAGCDNLL